MTTEQLDQFEAILEDGIVGLCSGAGLMGQRQMVCPDVNDLWEKSYLQSYVADAVRNFNDYPEAALGFAAFLGMAVAHNWDRCWTKFSKASYESYYGSRGWDNMDDHIMADVLRLKPEQMKKVISAVEGCTMATLGLIRHQAIEAQTADGFYVLVRAYSVMFRTGVSIELTRKGYIMEVR